MKVTIVSASESVWSGEAQQISARTVEGEIGILAGHEPVLAVLAPGERDANLAAGENRQHGLVPGQDADLALDGLRDHHGRLARPDLLVGRDDAHVERGHDQPFSFWICAHFSSTSEMPPTLKKACSATWSKSPRTIASNDSMVSFSGTVEPSTPVNFFAM